MMRQKSKYRIFVIVLYLFVFEFALMGAIDAFKYIDEIYAVMFIPLLILNKMRMSQSNIKIIFINVLFVAIGILGNIIFRYQVVPAVIVDILLNMKFVLGIYTTYLLFRGFSFAKYSDKIRRHVKSIITVLFLLVAIDEILGVFPCNEIRYGIRSEQLFFGHPTGLASVSFFLLLLTVCFFSYRSSDKIAVIMGSILLISTLRLKAIASFGVFFLLYWQIIYQKKRVTVWHILPLMPALIMVSWDQIYGYFFSGARMDMARGALLYKSFEIAKDHFPIGAGLATFASAPSSDHYSILYEMYGLSGVFGITREFSGLVSDTFWPMILGQTGYFGLIVYLFMLKSIFMKIVKAYTIDIKMYFIGLGALGYLFVSSISESAFVNPLSLSLSLVIGIVFISIEKMELHRR